MTETLRSVLAEDGYELRYRVWAGSAESRATMIMLNGVMSHSGWFYTLAEPLAALNLRVVGADRRGSGMNQSGRGDAPSLQILIRDLRRIIEHEITGGGPVYLIGWCWGGVLAINAALEFGGLMDGIILLAPGLFPSEPVKFAMQEQFQAARSNPPDVPSLASPIREEMFTEGPDLGGFILKDNLRLRALTPRFYGIMLRMGASAVTRLKRLAHPVLLILASKDAAVDNHRTFLAFHGLTNASVTFASCHCRHGMQFEAAPELVSEIVSWLSLERGWSLAAAPPR